MIIKAVSTRELAEMFGKSYAWMGANWRSLVKKKVLPPPLLGDEGHPTWDAAQVYAFMDGKLPAAARANAAAFRAALDAAISAPTDAHARDEVLEARRELDQRFSGRAAS